VILAFNRTNSGEFVRGRIANITEPIPNYASHQTSEYAGIIFVRAEDALGRLAGLPFTLDDAALGVLDNALDILV